jgi:hypothetical protein
LPTAACLRDQRSTGRKWVHDRETIIGSRRPGTNLVFDAIFELLHD